MAVRDVATRAGDIGIVSLLRESSLESPVGSLKAKFYGGNYAEGDKHHLTNKALMHSSAYIDILKNLRTAFDPTVDARSYGSNLSRDIKQLARVTNSTPVSDDYIMVLETFMVFVAATDFTTRVAKTLTALGGGQVKKNL